MFTQALYFECLEDAQKAETALREMGLEADLAGTNYHGEFAVEWTTDNKLGSRERGRLIRLTQPDSVGFNQEMDGSN